MPTTATVFEIKRCAVHDGPGVRTTLFLKGCPLRCRWCHNPEGIAPGPQLAYYDHKCLACGECVSVCEANVHSIIDGRHVVNTASCTACGKCVDACLGRSLRLYGQNLTVEHARQIVLEDREFYSGGGGVTLSGGEPLLQAGFCAELLSWLKQDGIHCAVDTSGAVGWQAFQKVLPHADTFLYDVKHADDSKHQQYTGQSNSRIVDNLRRLSECDVPIEVRIPLITGFNDDGKSIDSIGALLSELRGVVAVRLLPYHHAGSKYQAIGLDALMLALEEPSSVRIEEIAAQFKSLLDCPRVKLYV